MKRRISLDELRKAAQREKEAAEKKAVQQRVEAEVEARYVKAWSAVLDTCVRIAAGEKPTLSSLNVLKRSLKERKRWEWISEMHENFSEWLTEYHEAFGLEGPRDIRAKERHAELLFVEALLQPRKAMALLVEACENAPFGLTDTARHIHEYLRHHPEVQIEILKRRRKQMLELAKPVVETFARKRPALERNLTFLVWSDAGSGPAEIRDRWNAENPNDQIGDTKKKDLGREVVKQGIISAQKAVKELKKQGVTLTAAELREVLS